MPLICKALANQQNWCRDNLILTHPLISNNNQFSSLQIWTIWVPCGYKVSQIWTDSRLVKRCCCQYVWVNELGEVNSIPGPKANIQLNPKSNYLINVSVYNKSIIPCNVILFCLLSGCSNYAARRHMSEDLSGRQRHPSAGSPTQNAPHNRYFSCEF